MTSPTQIRSTYRDHPHVARAVRIGGVDRLALLAEIQKHGIELNQAGLQLFATSGPLLRTAPVPYPVPEK